MNRISALQVGVQEKSATSRIAQSLRMLTPLVFLLITARSQLEEFAARAGASFLKAFCEMFTRLPRRSDAEIAGMENASTNVKHWIDTILMEAGYWYLVQLSNFG